MEFIDPESYVDGSDHLRLERATRFEDLRDVMLDVLLRMPDGVYVVSGPMGTGGVGSLTENMVIFRQAINALALRGVNVFTQLLFQEHMVRILSGRPFYEEGEKPLEIFYRPLLCSQKVTTVCFLPLWSTSFGARWEHRLADRLGLERQYVVPDFHGQFPEVSILVPHSYEVVGGF